MARRKTNMDRIMDDGHVAAGSGIGQHMNPYPPGPEHDAWDRGWNSFGGGKPVPPIPPDAIPDSPETPPEGTDVAG